MTFVSLAPDNRPAPVTVFDHALKAFLDDLAAAKLAERVTVLAFSEFGRTVKENGSAGTDHGTAEPMFLIGGGLQGGLYGSYPSMADLDVGDLKFTTDFRSVYGTVLDKWLKAPSQTVLGRKFPSLSIV